MATGSPGLAFGAAGGVAAEDFVFSTHLGGQLTWCCRLCSPSLLFPTHPTQQRYNPPDEQILITTTAGSVEISNNCISSPVIL